MVEVGHEVGEYPDIHGGYVLVQLHVHTCSGGKEGSVRWSVDGAGCGRGQGGHFGQIGDKG